MKNSYRVQQKMTITFEIIHSLTPFDRTF